MQVDGLHGQITGDSTGYVNAVRKAEQANESLIADSEKLAGTMQRASVAMDNAGVEAGQLGANFSGLEAALVRYNNSALVSTSRTNIMARGMTAVGNATKAIRPQFHNLSMQLQDIAVQTAAGTSIFVALGQNIPQLASQIGGMGHVVGLVAAVAFPALALILQQTIEPLKNLKDELKETEDILQLYASAVENANAPMQDLRERFANATPTVRQFYEELEQIQQSRVEDKLNAISKEVSELFGVRGDGFSGAGVARFFDLQAVLSLQADVRRGNRALIAEFQALQQAQVDSLPGTEEAVKNAAALLNLTAQMAEKSGEVTEEEAELLEYLRQVVENEVQLLELRQRSAAALERVSESVKAVEDAARAAAAVDFYQNWKQAQQIVLDTEAGLKNVYTQTQIISDEDFENYEELFKTSEKVREELGDAAFEALRLAGVDIASPIAAGAIEAAKLAQHLGVALQTAQALAAQTRKQLSDEDALMGQQVIPDEIKDRFGEEDLRRFGYNDNMLLQLGVIDPPKKSRKKRGGSIGKTPEQIRKELADKLAALQDSFKSEQQLQIEAFAAEREILAQAKNAELLTQEEFQQLSLNSAKAHSEAMIQIAQNQREQTLGQYQTLFGNMATIFEAGGQRTVGIAKAFSVAQGLLNSYRAFTEVLADPSLMGRPLLRTSLAASTLAAGLAQVASMRNVNMGSGGGSGGGGGASVGLGAGAGAAGASGPQLVEIALQGDTYGRDQVIDLINRINEAVEDGASLRLV